MRRLVKKINSLFLGVVLSVFYFVILGLAYLVWKALSFGDEEKKAHWEKPKTYRKKDYLSSY